MIRQESYRHFHARFIFIAKTLEASAYGLHQDEISYMFKDGWDPSSKAQASFKQYHLIATENMKLKAIT